jgi:hypothetical protein
MRRLFCSSSSLLTRRAIVPLRPMLQNPRCLSSQGAKRIVVVVSERGVIGAEKLEEGEKLPDREMMGGKDDDGKDDNGDSNSGSSGFFDSHSLTLTHFTIFNKLLVARSATHANNKLISLSTRNTFRCVCTHTHTRRSYNRRMVDSSAAHC